MLRHLGRRLGGLALCALALTGAPASAQSTEAVAPSAACAGRDLLAEVPAADLAEIRARADAAPYSRGILWQATKGDQRIVIAGTYHFGDRRHDATLTRLGPEIARAATVLVEAGPDEEKQLEEALRADPTLMSDPTGPTLPERLDAADWKRLSEAMEARGIPTAVASKLRPWYVATMLGLSPCMLQQAAAGLADKGLDYMVIGAAGDAGVPVRALEPWDTLFSVFAGMTPGDEVDMIRSALPQAEEADDYAFTLTEAYFAGDVWLLWEFGRYDAYRRSGLSRAEVDKMMDLTQRQLMDNRNRAWIAPLTEAAAEAARQHKQVVAAFGALHLPGEQGVLRLLENGGWAVTPLGPAARPQPKPDEPTEAPT